MPMHFTAILAMANTNPVTDTAEAAERILDLGRATGLVDVVPVGAVTKGLEGAELAELGLMHRSRAGVTVFSDDGRCVHDARVMRRALEYVRAFGGVVSQHAQDPHLAGPQACAHEGECRKVCEVPHVLDLTIKGRAEEPKLDVGPDCTRCGLCVDVCPTGALRYELKGVKRLL